MEEQEVEIIDENISNEQATKELKKGYSKAEKLINGGKLDEFLLKVEDKLKAIPNVGEKLSHIPVFISLVKSFIKKEYTEIPMGTIIAVVSALIYFLSPVDLIPDIIPGLGVIDDAAVVVACLALVDKDIVDYIKWRDENGNNTTVK